MTGPLDGLLVADFSRVLAGPYATMLLADLGAEVVKVEGPPGGDETRSWTPPERDGVSTYYLGINRGKRSIVLDLRAEDGPGPGPRAGPPRRRHDREPQAGRHGQVRPRLRVGARRQPGHRLRLDQRVRLGPRRRRARLRPAGAGDVGADEPHRVAGRPRLPRRHLGLRRDGRQPRGDRHPGGAAAPRRHRRRGSTSRSTCSPRRSPGWSTTARPGWPAAWCPTGWATRTRACSPTSRSRPRTPT